MNENTLLKYCANHLDTNIRIFTNKQHISKQVINLDDSAIFNIDNFDKTLLKVNKKNPQLFCIDDAYFYASILCDKYAILYGPIYNSHIIKLSNNFNFYTNKEYKINLNETSLNNFIESTLLLNNLINDTDIDFEYMILNNFQDQEINKKVNKIINDIRFEYNEDNKSHDSYKQEKRLISAIQSGDMKLVSEASMKSIKGDHGVVSINALQNDKNLAIVGITIASRAAINVGLSNEVVLSLTDGYIREIENATNSKDIETIVFNCNTHLTKLVSEYNGTNLNDNSPNYYSLKIKDYISKHLHQKISIKDISNELNVTPNYLSNIFKQSEGITISKYILNEKISLAKNMLIYSDTKLSDIALYLGFSTQSHFCTLFKKTTNLTPDEYRKSLS